MKKKRFYELALVVAVVAVVVLYLQKQSVQNDGATSSAATPSSISTPEPGATPSSAQESPTDPTLEYSGPLTPLPGKNPPRLTKSQRIKFETDHGDFVVEVFPQAAPNAAERFTQLVEKGFYDHTPISRIVPDFVVQFGINAKMSEWENRNFKDDPSLFQHLPGTIAFAKGGPDTNSTQVFINLVENNRLAEPSMNFTVFGRVIDGMDKIESWKVVGDPQMGLSQTRLWSEGDKYLQTLPEKPVMITKASLVPLVRL